MLILVSDSFQECSVDSISHLEIIINLTIIKIVG